METEQTAADSIITVIMIQVSLQEALDELATWLDVHPKEIIIISCSHFECLTDEDHSNLVEFIITLFAEKLCSSQVKTQRENRNCSVKC